MNLLLRCDEFYDEAVFTTEVKCWKKQHPGWTGFGGSLLAGNLVEAGRFAQRQNLLDPLIDLDHLMRDIPLDCHFSGLHGDYHIYITGHEFPYHHLCL